MHSYSIMIIAQQSVGIAIHFLMANVLQQQFLYCFTWSSNQLLNLNILSFLFLQLFLLINSISTFSLFWRLNLTFYHPPANSFPTFWLFLALSWMLRMLVTVHKACHVPHASWVRTRGAIFSERLFSVFKEWGQILVTRFLHNLW